MNFEENRPNMEFEQHRSIKEKNKSPGFIIVLFFFFLIVLIFVRFYFKVQSIEIIGNVFKSESEVLLAAGFKKGNNILFINKKEIEKEINKSRYFVYKNLYPLYPNKIFLHIHERLPIGNFQYMGINYVTDMEGMVLEQLEAIEDKENLVEFRGLNIKDCRVGKILALKHAEQFFAYKTILEELSHQNFSSQIDECNIYSIENLYLTTMVGHTVRLGNSEDMRAKIGATRAVLNALSQMNAPLGTIDVSSPIYPTFIPFQ